MNIAVAQIRELPSRTSETAERGWCVFFCALAVLILTAHLGGPALFEPDEGRNAEKAREILMLGDWVTPHENLLPTLDKPMAFYWLIALSFKLFGISEWAARLPSVLSAAGCLSIIYWFARKHWGVWEALWGCLVLLTSLEFFVLSRTVIFDMTLTFFITLALCSFFSAAHTEAPNQRRLHCIVMYVAMAVGTLVKGPIALLIPGMVIFFYLLAGRKWWLRSRMNLGIGCALYFVIVTPWYLWAEIRNPGYLRYFLWEEHFLRYLTPQFSRSQSWYYFFLVLPVGFLPWTAVLPLTFQNARRRASTDIGLFLILWVILPFAFFSASDAKLPHYILPIFPALAMLTGQAVAHAGEQHSRWTYAPWTLMLAVVCTLVMGVLWPELGPKRAREALAENDILIIVYATTLLAIFAVYGAGEALRVWKNHAAGYFSAAMALAMFFIMGGRIMIAASAERSSKELAGEIAPFIAPEDRLVFYDTYAEGLPYYLTIQKPIWLVQSESKLYVMGSWYVGEHRPVAAPDYGRVLLTFAELSEQWQRKDQSLRVLVKEKNLPRLTMDVGTEPKVLTRFDEYLLVSNR